MPASQPPLDANSELILPHATPNYLTFAGAGRPTRSTHEICFMSIKIQHPPVPASIRGRAGLPPGRFPPRSLPSSEGTKGWVPQRPASRRSSQSEGGSARPPPQVTALAPAHQHQPSTTGSDAALPRFLRQRQIRLPPLLVVRHASFAGSLVGTAR